MLAAGMLMAGSVFAAPGAERPVLKRVRAAAHSDYDRFVFDLDRPARVIRAGFLADGEFVIELEAQLSQARLGYDRKLARIRGLVAESLPTGTRLRVAAAPSRARVFLLDGPPRLVTDFAEPGVAAFAPPPGAVPVELADEPLVLNPSSAPEVAAPLKASAPRRAPARPVAAPPPGPAQVVPQRPPPASLPETPYRGLALAVWIGLGVVLLGGVVFWVGTGSKRRADRPGFGAARSELPRAPESITPAEIRAARDRIDVLEKRIDQEVRTRLQVEERLGEVQEQVKVLGDRVRRSRLVRRVRSPRPDAEFAIDDPGPTSPGVGR